MDKDGFIRVTRGHKLCASNKRRNGKMQDIRNYGGSVVSWSERVVHEIDTDYVQEFTDILLDILKRKFESSDTGGTPGGLEIVVYGLGNFSCCSNSLIQLSFIYHVRKLLSARYSVQTFAFDPLFNDEERQWLSENGFEIIPENERGIRSVTGITLFYMPHCDRQLYNNVLFANWTSDKLKSVLFFGNSFSAMVEGICNEKVRNELKYLFATAEFCREMAVKNLNGSHAFSDTALHHFEEDDLLLPFPRDTEEPDYQGFEEIET